MPYLRHNPQTGKFEEIPSDTKDRVKMMLVGIAYWVIAWPLIPLAWWWGSVER